jgi:hypothetical protein
MHGTVNCGVGADTRARPLSSAVYVCGDGIRFFKTAQAKCRETKIKLAATRQKY